MQRRVLGTCAGSLQRPLETSSSCCRSRSSSPPRARLRVRDEAQPSPRDPAARALTATLLDPPGPVEPLSAVHAADDMPRFRTLCTDFAAVAIQPIARTRHACSRTALSAPASSHRRSVTALASVGKPTCSRRPGRPTLPLSRRDPAALLGRSLRGFSCLRLVCNESTTTSQGAAEPEKESSRRPRGASAERSGAAGEDCSWVGGKNGGSAAASRARHQIKVLASSVHGTPQCKRVVRRVGQELAFLFGRDGVEAASPRCRSSRSRSPSSNLSTDQLDTCTVRMSAATSAAAPAPRLAQQPHRPAADVPPPRATSPPNSRDPDAHRDRSRSSTRTDPAEECRRRVEDYCGHVRLSREGQLPAFELLVLVRPTLSTSTRARAPAC